MMFSAIYRKGVLYFFVTVALSVSAQAISAQTADATFTIRSIRAMPYYTQTGEIRRTTDLFDRRLVLRNVILGSPLGPDPMGRTKIEDWDIVFGTRVTYVEVEVVARSALADVQNLPTLEFAATSGNTRREIGRLSVKLTATESQVWRIPFFVYGTGCEKLWINARLVTGKTRHDVQSRTIPFTCGE